MTQSQEELLPIQDAASFLQMSEAYVLAKLRLRQFKRVIIEKKTPTGSRWTAHFYFDKTLWPFTDVEEVVLKDSNEQAMTYMEGNERKEVHHRIVKDPLGNQYAAKGNTVVCDPSEDDWFYLCDPKDTREKTWLDDANMIYIPLAEVKAFQQEHCLHQEVKTQKANKRTGITPMPDISEILPEKWYGTYLAARYLGVSQKHLQNVLIHAISHKRKNNARWEIQGRGIIAYRKEHTSDS